MLCALAAKLGWDHPRVRPHASLPAGHLAREPQESVRAHDERSVTRSTTTASSTSARWAISGHPVAGRNWSKTLVKWLLEYGFVQCESD
eukprot:2288483-Prymnesium_polylepis.1